MSLITPLLNITSDVSHIEDHQILKYQASGAFTYIFRDCHIHIYVVDYMNQMSQMNDISALDDAQCDSH